MSVQGIGSREYFEHHYGARDWRVYSDLLAFVITHSNPGPILDLGAGTGLFLDAAARWGLTCVGVEGSPDAIELARSRTPEIHLIHHILPEPLPFSTASFQTVLMNQVIEHLAPETAREVLDECYRVLR